MPRRKKSTPAARREGVVSVVVLNYKGADVTLTCLNALQGLDFDSDQLEIVCVDNASGDGSYEKIKSEAPPSVTVVASPVNGGFTGGCNFGAKHATGEFLAFINNDARPDPLWLAEAVAALRADSSVSCVASKVLDWDGVNVDYVDAALAWYGMGYKPKAGSPYDGRNESPEDVLFATGSAMVVRSQVFADVGGFDERFFMFYEDVDLGWRLNILGHRVRYVPTSVVFHKHHATMKKYGSYREWYLLERNALLALYKNAEEKTLERVLAPALALSVRRGLATGGADTAVLDLQRSPGGDGEESVQVTKQSLTGAYAVDCFVDLLPSMADTRKELQRRRVRGDEELLPLLRNAIEPAIANERYLAGHQALVDAFGISEIFDFRRRILVVTADPLTDKMAGPAIRAFHISAALSAEHDVRLVSTAECSISDPRFTCLAAPTAQLRQQVAWADVVLFQGFLLEHAPWIVDTDVVLIADLYDPIHLEQLEQTKGAEAVRRARDIAATTEAINTQLRRADFFVCASEKQRHFWLGQLAGVGRLNPLNYDGDASLESLLAVVPFGLPDEPAQQTRSAIRGAVEGIGKDDKIILWAGGIYNWFDPLTLIKAMRALSDRHPDARLFFLGTQHPNPLVPAMRMVTEARRLADQLGLLDKVVFFNEGWVPYADRQNYLLDADLGVSTHFRHVETTFSFRTRILDYLWAGLPIVATEGDAFGDLIASERLGVAVPERDVDALARALERCLYDAEFAAKARARVDEVSAQFAWQHALRPLVEFCRRPRRAADARVIHAPPARSVAPPGLPAGVFGRNLHYAQTRFHEGGAREVVRRGTAKAARLTKSALRRAGA